MIALLLGAAFAVAVLVFAAWALAFTFWWFWVLLACTAIWASLNRRRHFRRVGIRSSR